MKESIVILNYFAYYIKNRLLKQLLSLTIYSWIQFILKIYIEWFENYVNENYKQLKIGLNKS